MKIVKIAFFVLLASTGIAQNSKLCGIWADSVSSYHFVTADNINGQIQDVSTLPLVFGTGGTSCLILDSGHYVFVGYDSLANQRYFTVDIQTGTLVNDTVASNFIYSLEVDPSTNIIYGLVYLSSIYYFVSFDNVSGQVVFLDTLDNVQTVVESVFNPINRQYIFRGRNNNDPIVIRRIYTIDIASGTLVNDTLSSDVVVFLAIDTSTGDIYGLWNDGNNYHFVSLDNLTGQKTNISMLSTVELLIAGTVVFNSTNGQYIFKGVNFGEPFSQKRFFTIDAFTGAIENEVLSTEDLRLLELCSDIGTSVEEERTDAFEIFVYPNPTAGNINIVGIPIGGSQITIYDAIGRVVVKEFISESLIDISNLPDGVFVVQAKSERATWSKKILKISY